MREFRQRRQSTALDTGFKSVTEQLGRVHK